MIEKEILSEIILDYQKNTLPPLGQLLFWVLEEVAKPSFFTP